MAGATCATPAAAPEALVKDAKSLLACLMRMHLSNEAVQFWNASREFKLMLRNDPVEADVVSFDLCIVPEDDEDDEDETLLRRVLELEHDGYDEDGAFVVDARSFAFDELARQPDLLDEVVARINSLYAYRVCKCGAYFIKDGAPLCLFCQLTQDAAADSTAHMCPICFEHGPARHMVRQACCGQMLHSRCLAQWAAASHHARCPLCRG